MTSRPMIKESLWLLGFSYLNPLRSNEPVISIAILIFFAFVTVDICLSCVLNWRGMESVENVQHVAEMIQTIIKFSIFNIYNQNLKRVLADIDQFWKWDKYGSQSEAKIKSTFKMGQIGIAIFTLIIFTYAILMVLYSLFNINQKILFFSSYFFYNQGPSLFYAGFLIQSIIMVLTTPLQLGVDVLLISLVINVTCEIDLLNLGFEVFSRELMKDSKAANRKLGELIQHHNLIFECVQETRKVYSVILLLTLVISSIFVAISMICLTANGDSIDYTELLKYLISLVFYVMQLFFYCLPGTVLTYKCSEVARAAYNVNWWITGQPEIRRSLTMVILRSNKLEFLSAGGTTNVNLDTFVKILKTAYSFYSVTQAQHSSPKNHAVTTELN